MELMQELRDTLTSASPSPRREGRDERGWRGEDGGPMICACGSGAVRGWLIRRRPHRSAPGSVAVAVAVVVAVAAGAVVGHCSSRHPRRQGDEIV